MCVWGGVSLNPKYSVNENVFQGLTYLTDLFQYYVTCIRKLLISSEITTYKMGHFMF